MPMPNEGPGDPYRIPGDPYKIPDSVEAFLGAAKTVEEPESAKLIRPRTRAEMVELAQRSHRLFHVITEAITAHLAAEGYDACDASQIAFSAICETLEATIAALLRVPAVVIGDRVMQGLVMEVAALASRAISVGCQHGVAEWRAARAAVQKDAQL